MAQDLDFRQKRTWAARGGKRKSRPIFEINERPISMAWQKILLIIPLMGSAVSAQPLNLTFKGLEFGSCELSFLQTFKDARYVDAKWLETQSYRACGEKGSYFLGRLGDYTASFYRDQLFMVVFRWPTGSRDPESELNFLSGKITEYFGTPDPNNFRNKRWEINSQQGISLEHCLTWTSAPCDPPYIQTMLADKRFAIRKERDF